MDHQLHRVACHLSRSESGRPEITRLRIAAVDGRLGTSIQLIIHLHIFRTGQGTFRRDLCVDLDTRIAGNIEYLGIPDAFPLRSLRHKSIGLYTEHGSFAYIRSIQVPSRGTGVGNRAIDIGSIIEILRYDRTGRRKIQPVADPVCAAPTLGSRRMT
jgi:hypothetical protein